MSALDLDGATITLLNYGTGKCIDLPDGSRNGKPLVGTKFQSLQSQMWKVELADKSTVWPLFKLQNVKFGRYADLSGGNKASGTGIQCWEKYPNNNQLWRFVSADPQGRVIMIQNYGSGTYFDLYSGNPEDGTQVKGWAGNIETKNIHQLWRVLRIN
ncbi:carbohydrate-binding module family 13 protein [Xylariaceae sp. FL0594]|nr:carbohydrate-binding module family 13 protein [Xylariaceae sp. FL0594]